MTNKQKRKQRKNAQQNARRAKVPRVLPTLIQQLAWLLSQSRLTQQQLCVIPVTPEIRAMPLYMSPYVNSGEFLLPVGRPLDFWDDGPNPE